MMHQRVWAVVNVATPEELAEKLTEATWCGCAGFRLGGYLWLNDATSADGAQEYAVVHEATRRQVESITFSWCSYQRALELIRRVLAGEFDGECYDVIDPARIVPAKGHRCYLCA